MMDHIATQQLRRSLEYKVFQAIKEFEETTKEQVDQMSLGRVEGVKGITSVGINIKEQYNGS